MLLLLVATALTPNGAFMAALASVLDTSRTPKTTAATARLERICIANLPRIELVTFGGEDSEQSRGR
jgi:hypothetical protein